MCHDDRGRPVFNGKRKNFPRMNKRGDKRTDSDYSAVYKASGAVECKQDKMLLLFIFYMIQMIHSFRGGIDQRGGLLYEPPAPELERRKNDSRLSVADPLY